jgi:hypothetical protein
LLIFALGIRDSPRSLALSAAAATRRTLSETNEVVSNDIFLGREQSQWVTTAAATDEAVRIALHGCSEDLEEGLGQGQGQGQEERQDREYTIYTVYTIYIILFV